MAFSNYSRARRTYCLQKVHVIIYLRVALIPLISYDIIFIDLYICYNIELKVVIRGTASISAAGRVVLDVIALNCCKTIPLLAKWAFKTWHYPPQTQPICRKVMDYTVYGVIRYELSWRRVFAVDNLEMDQHKPLSCCKNSRGEKGHSFE